MPNWCNNSLVITHKEKEKLESLYEIIKEYDETQEGDERSTFFGKILPVPNESSNQGTSRDFRVNHWGTKWEPNILSVSFEEGTQWIEPLKDALLTKDPVVQALFKGNIEYAEYTMRRKQIILEFDTAWSPPMGIMQELVKQGFRTNHVYMECGNSYWGFEMNGREVASGNMCDYMTDAFGNTYAEWLNLEEGAEGKGKKTEKTRSVNRFYPEHGKFFLVDETYDEWEIDWEHDPDKSREKARQLGISDAIWSHVELDIERGG